MKTKLNVNNKMNDLIKENSSLLLTISRFGVPLGFGDKTIHEVCTRNGVDVNTFMSVVEYVLDGKEPEDADFDKISVETIISYLKSAHAYFLSYKLPQVREKLLNAIQEESGESPHKLMILNFFDDYVSEVQKHMEHENRLVFPYAIGLLRGEKDPAYNISVFEQNHENIDSKLTDLKNILIKYYPANEPNFGLNDVLFELLACEKDLNTHNSVEDYFFVPLIESFEKKLI